MLHFSARWTAKAPRRLQFALTNIYGVGAKTSHRICARLSIHDRCRVRNLTPNQITALASFLQSPSTSPPLPILPLASPSFVPPPPDTPISGLQQPKIPSKTAKNAIKARNRWNADPLSNLKIESELRREIRENIMHQRMIGSYVGLRHAMGLPVRGQNPETNARTAKRLNKVDRKL